MRSSFPPWSAHARLSRREDSSVRRRRARPEETMWRVVLAVGLGAAFEALLGWLLRRRRPASATASEVIFFPSRVTCTEELLAGAPCACPLPHGESALGRLLVRVLAARRSLDLCLFAFSSPQLGRAVVLLHRRGVRIRLVVDADYMALRGSQIGPLRRAGKGRGRAAVGGAGTPATNGREGKEKSDQTIARSGGREGGGGGKSGRGDRWAGLLESWELKSISLSWAKG